MRSLLVVACVALLLQAAGPEAPDQYFGFHIGADGELGAILQSGWLLGEEYLRDQANVVAFRVGKGCVVTFGSQVDFRAQPRTTFKLLFNAIFHGPSTRVPAGAIGG